MQCAERTGMVVYNKNVAAGGPLGCSGRARRQLFPLSPLQGQQADLMTTSTDCLILYLRASLAIQNSVISSWKRS